MDREVSSLTHELWDHTMKRGTLSRSGQGTIRGDRE